MTGLCSDFWSTVAHFHTNYAIMEQNIIKGSLKSEDDPFWIQVLYKDMKSFNVQTLFSFFFLAAHWSASISL